MVNILTDMLLYVMASSEPTYWFSFRYTYIESSEPTDCYTSMEPTGFHSVTLTLNRQNPRIVTLPWNPRIFIPLHIHGTHGFSFRYTSMEPTGFHSVTLQLNGSVTEFKPVGSDDDVMDNYHTEAFRPKTV
jgi:hypothetical protein